MGNSNRLAIQFVYKDSKDEDRHRFRVIVVPEEDKEFLRSNPKAVFAFFVIRENNYLLRLATAEFVEDVQISRKGSMEDDKIIKKILKLLKDREFETAVVVSPYDYISDTINGNNPNEDEETEEWSAERTKLYNKAVSQQVTAERSYPESWYWNHIIQMLNSNDQRVLNKRMDIYV